MTITLEEFVRLLDASTRLRTIAYLLADGGASSYESPASSEKLTFARSGDQVMISANYTDATATVALAELQAATSRFHARVTRDLLARYPGLDETSGARGYFPLPPALGA
jgi:hypothetical protein